MTYRDVLARTERRHLDGSPVWPLAFQDRPRRIDARSDETREAGFGPKDESLSRRARQTTLIEGQS